MYGSSRKSYQKSLNTIHHEGSRLILGIFSSSSVESLYTKAYEPPVLLKFEVWRSSRSGIKRLGVVKLFNMQHKLMDVHQSDISKILPSSTSNLVSFIFIRSRHFTEAYLVLLHKTSHTSCILFFFWFPHAGWRESTPSVSLR